MALTSVHVQKVAVIGAGSWGTTVASLLAARATTMLWARSPEIAREIGEQGTNRSYLAAVRLHPGLRATASLPEAVSAADVVVMAVPANGFRAVLDAAAPHIGPDVPIVSLTKGLERGTRLRMSEIVGELLPANGIAALTGPNLAGEVIRGRPAAAVIACLDEEVARELQALFSTRRFRVYTTTDLTGAELAGSLKNVAAIGTGIGDGLGAGDNARATVITRSLAELTRLGTAMGARAETFAGLAGMGDLIATCSSPLSRNRYVGEQLGRGRSIGEITAEMRMVAEGVSTTAVVDELAVEYQLELPIAREVHLVLQGRRPPREAFRQLLRTMPTTELAAG
jgi:glycerol-3-phosphate dehydrogenase (NAD(P)+)